ncbi:hypothetical protein ScPMuIL_001877 [Solemya velum]
MFVTRNQDFVSVVENVFSEGELEPCKTAVNGIVDDLAQRLHKGGKIQNLYSDYGFNERLTMLEKEFPAATILPHKNMTIPQAFRNIWASEKLLNIAEQLIGGDIVGHPVWNLRLKTPATQFATVPWHQDVGYLENDSYKVHQVSVWIPLLDTDQENGCLEFAHRGHKTGRVGEHLCCYKDTWYVWIEEEEMKQTLDIDPERDFVVCPVPYGGIVLFNNLIPHRSLANTSNKIRWSLDFRFQRPQLPIAFYGLKEGVLFRSSEKPDHVIDWEPFTAVVRGQAQEEALSGTKMDEADEFDSTMPGPWMGKWRIANKNRHVEKFLKWQTA